jgi:hypothetical protein
MSAYVIPPSVRERTPETPELPRPPTPTGQLTCVEKPTLLLNSDETLER